MPLLLATTLIADDRPEGAAGAMSHIEQTLEELGVADKNLRHALASLRLAPPTPRVASQKPGVLKRRA